MVERGEGVPDVDLCGRSWVGQLKSPRGQKQELSLQAMGRCLSWVGQRQQSPRGPLGLQAWGQNLRSIREK